MKSLFLTGVAAHVTLSDQNTLTSELWEGEKGNFLKVWSCAFFVHAECSSRGALFLEKEL